MAIKKIVSVRIQIEVMRRLKVVAKKRFLSVSELIREILAESVVDVEVD